MNTTLLGYYHLQNRCELLSNFKFIFDEHNNLRFLAQSSSVVNCFQILSLSSMNTTEANQSITNTML